MSPFADFLRLLLHEGRAILHGHPGAPVFLDPDAMQLLERAFGCYRLDIAGPLIDIDGPTCLAATGLLANACWFLVSRDEPESELQRLLTLAGPPRSACQHLSADLVLRFLPQVHRRAKAHSPSDRLTALVADVLRRWPLSGVLADVEEAPLTSIDFDGHPGLAMLYAERFVRHQKAAWMPKGAGLEYLELVRGQPLGKGSA